MLDESLGSIQEHPVITVVDLEVDFGNVGVLPGDAYERVRLHPPKTVDGLVVVTHHKQASAAEGNQAPKNTDLLVISVLKLVHKHTSVSSLNLLPHLHIATSGNKQLLQTTTRTHAACK